MYHNICKYDITAQMETSEIEEVHLIIKSEWMCVVNPLCGRTDSTRYMSVACPNSGNLELSGADMQDFHFWWMPEHDVADQSNLAQSRQEVTPQKNIITSGYFSK